MVEAHIENYLKTLGHHIARKPWNKLCVRLFQSAQVTHYGPTTLWRESGLSSTEFSCARAGADMEAFNVELEEATKQVDEAKALLKDSVNEIQRLHEVLFPMMKTQIETLRGARMTLQQESKQCLQSLRDVRQFFMESDYDKEISRLERFVALCRDLQRLKQEGVLDAIADTAIRLSLREG